MISHITTKSSLQARRGCREPLRRSGRRALSGGPFAHLLGSRGNAVDDGTPSTCAKWAPSRTSEDGAEADTLDIFPYTDAGNRGGGAVASPPSRHTPRATKMVGQSHCLHCPIALNMESVSSWEEDTAASTAPQTEYCCHSSDGLSSANVSTVNSFMCCGCFPQRVAAQHTERTDNSAAEVTPVAAFYRLNARLQRARRRNRMRALSASSGGATVLHQQVSRIGDCSGHRVRPLLLPSRLPSELAETHGVIDLLSEDWSS
ncbi:hypothetical protein JKF63_05914 [Porcisia hertigi]|uniref:Uncharacterized protein n=1 Tax=Porcisia hertigi TaxID=2761500 RepID=A0A836IU30_9TRYP|nr:hypothetical protein JKF63_05914 [Porcisia hertigi]